MSGMNTCNDAQNSEECILKWPVKRGEALKGGAGGFNTRSANVFMLLY